MPEHRPSMLSSRFSALVMPTIQKIVSIESPNIDWVQPRRSPKNASADATLICTTSLVDAFSDNTSSTKPNAAITSPEPISCHMRASGPIIAPRASVVIAMATPPKSAVGFLCQRSSFGAATKPNRCASERQTNVNSNDSARAARKPEISVAIGETTGGYLHFPEGTSTRPRCHGEGGRHETVLVRTFEQPRPSAAVERGRPRATAPQLRATARLRTARGTQDREPQ